LTNSSCEVSADGIGDVRVAELIDQAVWQIEHLRLGKPERTRIRAAS